MARQFEYEHHAWRDENGNLWDSLTGGNMVASRVPTQVSARPTLTVGGNTAQGGNDAINFDDEGKVKRLGSGFAVPANNPGEMKQRLDKSPAPRVTPQRVEDVIHGVTFFHHNLLTICVLDLANGFTVTGESACAASENYSRVIGEQLAYDMAKQKIWSLEGYLLRQRLHDNEQLQHAQNDLQQSAADDQRVVGP